MVCATPDQYLPNSLHRYEWIFGRDFLNSGGLDATKALAATVPIAQGTRVLDVGSGLGGAAFYLSSAHGADVTGIDVLESMVKESTARAKLRGASNVKFICGDILDTEFDDGLFDVIWSQDAFLHIPDKQKLFAKLFRLLRLGGLLTFTDYARRQRGGSKEFEEYAAASNYSLCTLNDYAGVLERVGFEKIAHEDATPQFVKYLQEELRQIESGANATGETISNSDRNYLRDRWRLKLRCCESGDMIRAGFQARKS